MKLTSIFTLFTLIVIVKGAWWAAAVQPVILSLGAVLGTIDQDVLDLQPIAQKNWNIFKSDKKETQSSDTKEELS